MTQAPHRFDQATAKAQIGVLWVQVQLAVARFVALIVFIAMHWVLGNLIESVVPQGWKRGAQLFEGIFYVGFGLVYLSQVLEMLAIFVPHLRILQTKLLGEHNPE